MPHIVYVHLPHKRIAGDSKPAVNTRVRVYDSRLSPLHWMYTRSSRVVGANI